MGILDFRVRQNTKQCDANAKVTERQREKLQKMEVDQAGWKSTLEAINRRLADIDKKLERE